MPNTCRLPATFSSLPLPAEEQRKQYLANLITFLREFQWLSSVHAYDALTDGFFDKLWPVDWRPLADESMFDANHLISLVKDGIIQPHWPESLQRFIANCHRLRLPRNVEPADFGVALNDVSETVNYHTATTLSGMSRKKLHEVERFSRVILDRIRNSEIAESATIVDVGAGQGYLTHRLSTEYECVAVDFDQIQTVGSVSRGKNIKKGFVKDMRQENGGTMNGPISHSAFIAVPDRKPVLYKTIMINAAKLQGLLSELENAGIDDSSKRQFVLVGLHACGDLSGPAMLRTFEQCASVKMMAVVPCCFNLLTEPESPDQACESHGFPMSLTVRSFCELHALTLGFKARNLSTQNLECFDAEGIRSNLIGHYKRSLLDALLWHFNLEPATAATHSIKSKETSVADALQPPPPSERKQHKFRLGKMPIEAYEGGFLPYALAALERLGLGSCGITSDKIREFMQLPQYSNAERQVFVIHCVKSLLSRVLESLVLMDRFMALEEMSNRSISNGSGGAPKIHVEMLNLFDVMESPRNMVYLATKLQ